MPRRSLTLDQLPALHRCVDDGSLELLYQPEIDLQTGGIVAMEGLLRWHHESLGILEPPAFLELADASGEILPIGEWVLRAGAEEAARWTALPGPTRRLWLNISAAELVAEGFVRLVCDVVSAHGLPEGALGLEIAESCIVALGPSAAPLLEELRAAGVALAVDDFSSFYATLGAIEVLPIDAVKLNSRYVRGVGELVGPDGEGDPLVTAVVAQAHDRGLYVVAEGVETWGEAARLTELGCDRAHGWLFASAQRADKARWLLEHGKGWHRDGVPLPRSEA
ncbi:MAG: signaling protein [Frankiales bacterium]|jgi:EAL domain-containing protein (putative c-di-GMP-specific phosphodiesterase class I)|nr:signaling protein [Frankiales bacterium]